MRSLRCCFYFLMLLLFAVPDAHSQGCRLDYTPEYSSYYTISYDGTYLYTKVVVDGYTAGNGSAGCPPGAIHTPYATNKINSTGGQIAGAGGCMSCGESVENDQKIPAQAGDDIDFEWATQIICSVYGTFYSSGGSFPITIKLSTSQWQWTGEGVEDGACLYQAWCTSTCITADSTEYIVGTDFPTDCPFYMACEDFAVKYLGVTECADVNACVRATGTGACT